MRPAGADLPDDPLDRLDAARAGIDVGGPQLGKQKMPPAEHVKRQIAVAVVIAVEEAALLMPVQRVVRRIEVENDLLGRPWCASRNSVTGNASIAASL